MMQDAIIQHSSKEPGPRELRKAMPELRRARSYITSLSLFIINIIIYCVTFIYMFYYDQPILNVVCALINGAVIGLLFIIGHDACHGSFTPSDKLNHILGRLAFLPSLQPFASWAYTHNGLHHGWTNLKGKDVVFPPFTLEEYQKLNWPRRQLERIYRSPLGVALMYLVEIWLKYELLPRRADFPKNRKQFQYDRMLVLAFMSLQIVLAYFLCFNEQNTIPYNILRVVVYLAISYFVWFLLIGVITLQQHTHPDVPWYNTEREWNYYRGHIHGTPHLDYPLWLQRLMHNIMDHNAHHVDPLIPLYNLKSSQQSLEKSVGQDIVKNNGYISQYVKTLRICRLYDFVKHQWTDYDGTPTSPSNLDVMPSQVPPTTDQQCSLDLNRSVSSPSECSLLSR